MNGDVAERTEAYRPLVNPLIAMLSDSEPKIVVRALQALKELSVNETLRNLMIESGVTSVLCSYIV